MKCPECQHEYADRIPKCPYCGGLGITPSLPEEEESGITIYYENIALKIAGIVLLFNSAIIIAISLINMMKTGEKDFIASVSIINIILGIAILKGSSRAITWTKVLLILGILVSLIEFFITKNYLSISFQLIYCFSLLGLLASRPKKWRIILSIIFFVLYFCFVFLGVLALFFLIDN